MARKLSLTDPCSVPEAVPSRVPKKERVLGLAVMKRMVPDIDPAP